MTIGEEPINVDKVQKLREALHAKAKESPDFRFYSLYDKVYREDVLWSAFWRCRFNDGAAGVDGQTFLGILDYGVKRWLDELAETLLDEDTVVQRLNRMLTGWANYFRQGPVSEAYRNIDRHARQQLRKWLVAKHKGKGRGIDQYPDPYLYRTLGLVQLTAVRTRYLRERSA